MKIVTLTLLILTLTSSHAMHRGREYMKEKVCQEFNSTGRDNFRAGTIIASSQKYSNATYEEIINIVNEIVSIAEKCCPKEAHPECYEIESLALSAKSCSDPTPYPKHLGMDVCCVEKGLQQKLCLADLRHPPKEFPTYVEPSNDEICEAFVKDPQGFADRYLYEYATDYSQAPLPILAASAKSYLSMVAACCISKQPTACFLNERLARKGAAMLTRVSNKACSHYHLLGKERTKLSYIIKFSKKSTNASFEDVIFLAEDASEVLSKACNSTTDDSFQREVFEHITKICEKLSTKDKKFEECCSDTNSMCKYHCIYSLPWTKSPQLPDFPKPADEDLCGENAERELNRYSFEIARRYTYAPEVLFTAIYDSSKNIMSGCCSEADSKACFAAKRPQAREQIFNLLAKGNELCEEYNAHTFLEFKKRLRETYHKKLPEATEEVISGLVERKATFASTCCLLNAPPAYCGLKCLKSPVYIRLDGKLVTF